MENVTIEYLEVKLKELDTCSTQSSRNKVLAEIKEIQSKLQPYKPYPNRRMYD